MASGCANPPEASPSTPLVDLCTQAEAVAESLYVVDRAIEIGRDTVALVDAGDHALLLIDLNSGVIHRVGREGRGPGEFKHPGPVIRLPDGVIGVPDRPGRLLHLFRSDGSFIRRAQMPPSLFLESVFHSDSSGRLYVTLAGRPSGMSTNEGHDSIPVISFMVDSESTDTAWKLRSPDIRQFATGDGGTAFMPLPFSSQMTFGVSWNGLLWRIGSEPARIDTRRGTALPVMGETWSDPALPVTGDDRDSVLDDFATSRMPGIQLEFADQKPLFSDSRIAPWGEAWVRMTALRNSLALYRIYDSSGAAVDSTAMSPACTVVGFGRGRVFLVRTGNDGFSSLLSAPLTRH